MTKALNIVTGLFVLLLISCGGKEEKKKEGFSYEKKEATEKVVKKAETIPASKRVDLSNKGIGPITSMALNAEIDQTMVTHGADVFKKMCTACHRTNKKFIGPPPAGIFERRSPEWVMNMILNPEGMVEKDPIAKELLKRYISPMANQNLTQEEARMVLEYFRTIK